MTMRIKAIQVSNFKSLVDFRLDLAKFNCLIGLNGAGKSTVLQFIDFFSQLVHGDMKAWLRERKWNTVDLKSKLTRKVNIDFCVWFTGSNGEIAGRWEATYNPKQNRCTRERLDLLNCLVETEKDVVTITNLSEGSVTTHEIAVDYEGSILSRIKRDLLPESALKCKEFIQSITSLDLLAPEYLRQRTRESAGKLGLGGQNLSAFLHEMSIPKRRQLITYLRQVYPRLQELHAKSLRSGWKQIEITEAFMGPESGLLPAMTTEARHINDGMLRLIAILAELATPNRFLLFDEIENGINPELVEFLIDKLVNATQQVLVTTHSPMILNYLEDDIARAGVIYLYMTSQGFTKSIPIFSIPSLAEKLTVMGPGEAFVDTKLSELDQEIQSISEGH